MSPTWATQHWSAAWPLKITDLALSNDGHIVYASDINVLRVIDVSSPNSPTQLSSFSGGSRFYRVSSSPDGNTAYVAADSQAGIKGLQIIDVITHQPVRDRELQLRWMAQRCRSFSGWNQAFIVDQFMGLFVFDVSNWQHNAYKVLNDNGLDVSATISNQWAIASAYGGLNVINVSSDREKTSTALMEIERFTYKWKRWQGSSLFQRWKNCIHSRWHSSRIMDLF